MLVTAVVGLGFAVVASRINTSLSFFWLPSRVWELAAGGLLACAEFSHPRALRGGRIERALPLLCLAALAVSMQGVHLDRNHPGVATVPTVLATVVSIWFAAPQSRVTQLLASRPAVAVGLISYGLYLWHYPIFAFGRLLQPEPGFTEKATWVVLTFLCAIPSFVLIERPFRRHVQLRLPELGALAGLAAAVVLVFAATMLTTEGWRIVSGTDRELRQERVRQRDPAATFLVDPERQGGRCSPWALGCRRAVGIRTQGALVRLRARGPPGADHRQLALQGHVQRLRREPRALPRLPVRPLCARSGHPQSTDRPAVRGAELRRRRHRRNFVPHEFAHATPPARPDRAHQEHRPHRRAVFKLLRTSDRRRFAAIRLAIAERRRNGRARPIEAPRL